MQRYSALGFGMPEEGHSTIDRMHARSCAIITMPMQAGWSCNVEKQEHVDLLETMTRSAIPYFPWLTSASV